MTSPAQQIPLPEIVRDVSPSKRFPVTEIFGPTLQGEGAHIGLRTMFVRFGACDGVSGHNDWCTWCDSMYAVDPINKARWLLLTARDIVDRLEELSEETGCRNVTFTGGNPALHDLDSLMIMLSYQWSVNVETQATIWRDWLEEVDCITMSPKPPSAGKFNKDKFHRFVWNAFRSKAYFLEHKRVLKIVVGDDIDYEFARDLIIEYQHLSWEHVSLSALTTPGNFRLEDLRDQSRWLADKVINDALIGDVRVLFQYHVMLWGDLRGV